MAFDLNDTTNHMAHIRLCQMGHVTWPMGQMIAISLFQEEVTKDIAK